MSNKAFTLVKSLGEVVSGDPTILSKEVLEKIAYGSDFVLALDSKTMKTACVYFVPFSSTVDRTRNKELEIFSKPILYFRGTEYALSVKDFTEIINTGGIDSFDDYVECKEDGVKNSEQQLEFMRAIQNVFVPDSDAIYEDKDPYSSEEEWYEAIDFAEKEENIGSRFIGMWQYNEKRHLFVPIYFPVPK